MPGLYQSTHYRVRRMRAALVVGTLDALGFLLTGLKLALSDRRYLFWSSTPACTMP